MNHINRRILNLAASIVLTVIAYLDAKDASKR